MCAGPFPFAISSSSVILMENRIHFRREGGVKSEPGVKLEFVHMYCENTCNRSIAFTLQTPEGKAQKSP